MFLRERCSVEVHQRYGYRAQIREFCVSALLLDDAVQLLSSGVFSFPG
jgi:hypothetical protein